MIVTLNNVGSIELPSMSPLIWFTGGDLIFMNPFVAVEHGEKLHYEIFRLLTRTQVFNVNFKARTSIGYHAKEYVGSFGFKEHS